MKTNTFLREHGACTEGAKWALELSPNMADVWDAMIAQNKYEWLIWTAAVAAQAHMVAELGNPFRKENQ